MNVKIVRKIPLMKHDHSINGRRFNLVINSGLKPAMNKLIHPAPKFAHWASLWLRPVFSKIDTE